MAAVYGTLAYVDPDTGETKMGFAQSIKPSSNFKVWTITLHKGLKFSDGTPFDAAAVAFSIQRDGNPATASPFQLVASSLQLKVVNATTVRITLPSPDTGFDGVVAQDFPFIPSPTAVAKWGADFKTHPTGAGPFVMDTWQIGSGMKMSRNPYYTNYKKGQPYLDKLEINNLVSMPQEVAAVSSGNAQLAWVQGGQFIRDMQHAGVAVRAHFASGGAPIMLNNATAPFDNVIARRAVQAALAPKGMGDSWLPGTPGSVNLFSSSSPFYDKKYNLPAQNPDKAQRLFDQLAAAGKPLSFTVNVPVGFPALGPYIQSQLAQYKNVTVKVQADLTSTYLTNLRSGNFQMTIGSLYWTNPVPLAVLNFQTGGPANYMHWSNKTVDAALGIIQRTNNRAVQKKQWGIVQQQFLGDMPVLLAQRGMFGVAYNHKQIAKVKSIEYGNIPMWDEIYRIDS
jgi:peptide/nickel transport system substrate-binding protein